MELSNAVLALSIENGVAPWEDESCPACCYPPQPYQYCPITPGRNIRVIMLFGTSRPESSVETKLIEVPLENHPDYYAVSYCWEGQVPDHQVYCDGKDLMVTANCKHALMRFRRGPGENILVWIDAICINQSPNQTTERNHQVAMMGEIYSAATEVWVWLGSSKLDNWPDAIIVLFEWLRDLDKAASHPDVEIRKQLIRNLANDVSVGHLASLSDAVPWMKRVWTVQEVALAKSSRLFRDEIVISSEGLCRASTVLAEISGSDPSLLLISRSLHVHTARFAIPKGISSGEENVQTIMEWTRRSMATEPRDKINGIMTILSQAGVVIPLPDYSKPVAQVYREAMIAMLRAGQPSSSNAIDDGGKETSGLQRKRQSTLFLSSQNVGILNFVHGIGRQEHGLASWVPDWSMSRYPLWPHPDFGREFNATASSQSRISLVKDGMGLLIEGMIYETIGSCAGNAYTYTYEGLGPREDYFAWSLNMQPTDPAWITLLKLYPRDSGEILFLWNIKVVRSFISFALGPDIKAVGRDARIELYNCLRSPTPEYPDYQITADLNAWDDWLCAMMECDFAFKEQTDVILQNFDHPLPNEEEIGRRGSPENITLRLNFLRERCQEFLIYWLLETPEFRVLESFSHKASRAGIWEILGDLDYQIMFKTQSGKLGMAPYSIRAGDQIVLLAGMRFPMVVRPQGDEYRLICPAYVHGIMYSEAWDDCWNDGTGLKSFVFI